MPQDFDIEDILKEFGATKEKTEQKKPVPAKRPAAQKTRPTDTSERPPRRRTEKTGSERAGNSGRIRTSKEGRIPPKPVQAADTVKDRRKNGRGILTILILAAILTGIAAGAGAFITSSGKVFPNVYAGKYELSGMTEQEAVTALAQTEFNTAQEQLLINTYCGISIPADTVKAGTGHDARSAAEAAAEYGRTGNIFSNLLTYIKCIFGNTDITELPPSIDTVYIDSLVRDCGEKLDSLLNEGSFFADKENGRLIIIKGSGSVKFNPADLKEKIIQALLRGDKTLEYTVEEDAPVFPDFQMIYSSVCSEAADAHFSDDGTHTIVPERAGYIFDVALAMEQWQQAQPGGEVSVPLDILQPSVTAEELEALMFRDLLGAVTTKYNNSNDNRCSNVRLATSKVDGVILYPGEEFSYNETVGARTEEAGFLLAPAYAGYGDIKDEIGGGVCQVSTGVYAAALFSFLDITSHTCHIYPPNYIQLGMDATVSIPEGGGRVLDLKIRNNKNFPVKIAGYCEETVNANGKPRRTVTIEIWGTLEEGDYMPIEFDNSYSDIYDYDRVIEPAYPDREGYKIKFTHDENEFEDDYGKGLRTTTHRKVYDSKGNLIEDRIINPTYSAGYALDTYYYKQ